MRRLIILVLPLLLAACQPVPPPPAPVPPELAGIKARLDAIEQLQGETLVELAGAMQRLPEPIPPPDAGLRCVLPDQLAVVIDNRGRIVGRIAVCMLAPVPDAAK